MKQLLTNGTVVLDTGILKNSAVLIEDGHILEVDPVSSGKARVSDLEGDYLFPGIIDLHSDAIERDIEPRPNVYFPFNLAIFQADKRNAAWGVTTAFHALSFAEGEFGVRNVRTAAELVRAIIGAAPHCLSRNYVHCRYEVSDAQGLEIVLKLLSEERVGLVSIMDHTPGQGQFKTVQSYRDFMVRTYALTDKEFDDMVQKKIDEAPQTFERINRLVAAATRQNKMAASHDDDSPERVKSMKSLGIRVSEFPVNKQTAEAARNEAMYTVFGAPNLVRGKSQSGSMRALDAINSNLASCLCSDYSPATLLLSIFQLSDTQVLRLEEATALITKNPAGAVNMTDRGEILPGKRADLIQVRKIQDCPQVTRTWISGREVYKASVPRNNGH